MRLVNEPASLRHFELLEQYPTKLPSGILPELKSIRDERLALVESTLAGEFYAPLKSILLDVLELTDANYRRRKRERAALDFSDLEERAIDLLRGDAHVLDSVRESFDQILMDELQDTNPLQWKLMDLLRSPRRFFAVGDINQSIFGFRHADPDVFRRYRESVAGADGTIDELYENFRSRGEILAAVEAIAGPHGRGREAQPAACAQLSSERAALGRSHRRLLSPAKPPPRTWRRAGSHAESSN